MAQKLRRVESLVPKRARAYGGKARNLAVLSRAGFPVPAAFALPGSACAEFLERVLPAEDRLASLLELPGRVPAERLEDIAARVRAAPLDAVLRLELGRALRELRRAGADAVVVRSSSTFEDQEAASAAGLHDTILNVFTEAALEAAVRDCWASLFQARVLAYLDTVVDAPDASMGVVVQAMVPAEVSGVLFTVNPLSGDPGEIVINAAWGLGCSVVEGRVSPDTYRVDKVSRALRDRVLGDKDVRVVALSAGGVSDEPVPGPMRAAPTLDDAVLNQLVAIGLRIEEHFEHPQDVEWAVVAGTVYVLQARPVTAVLPGLVGGRAKTRRERSRIVWSNINVGEALPGVATPLTWSVLSAFSELGFRRAFGSLGCSVPKDAELVGNFRGRIYLNLSEFFAIGSQVPGLKPRVLLALGGGGEVELLEAEAGSRSSLAFLLRLPVTVTRFIQENYRITRRVEQFEASFEDEKRRYAAMDLRVLPPRSLSKTLRDVERTLDDAGTVMLTCYGNLLVTVLVLRAVLRLVAGERAAALERDLLSGLTAVESAAPGLALWHIAEMARFDDGARELILSADPSTLEAASLPDGPTRRALERFIMAYGFRGPREAEIAAPRWREDPSLLFVTLRAHLRDGGGERPVDVERRQRERRDRVERELDAMVPPPVRAAIRHLLSLVQRFTRLRERLRAYVTEVLGRFRDAALDTSRRIEMHDPGAGNDAAFFLTLEELHGVLEGRVGSVAALVRQRRRQYERDRALPDPPDTFVGYPPQITPPPPDTDALEGLAASSGRAEGLARVLRSTAEAADLRAGEILVAPYADVGWSPLFTVAAAVVTDVGGPLSHASVVAREYGVPAVVNVKTGTRTIRTGDRILVDGDSGIVRILVPARKVHGGA